MKLYVSGASPYVRKVLVTAHELGIADQLELVPVATGPTAPHPDLLRDNPLAKIPTLVGNDGVALYDSRVICSYLCEVGVGRVKLEGRSDRQKLQIRKWESLADGICDAGILIRYETIARPEALRWPEWIAAQSGKVLGALDLLEANEMVYATDLSMAAIAIACALGWLEFRMPIADIRTGRPRLFAWYDEFKKRPSMQATAPTG
jgi:glutathione S-transferase